MILLPSTSLFGRSADFSMLARKNRRSFCLYFKGEKHMSLSSKKWLAVFGGLAVLGIYAAAPDAEARPQYNKGFTESYPKLEEAAKKVKCGLCHEGETKKVRNPYGLAVEKGIEKKNEKDTDVIAAALKKASEAKSEGSGKTFGQMIEAGELPK
jgi:hypothetical protein